MFDMWCVVRGGYIRALGSEDVCRRFAREHYPPNGDYAVLPAVENASTVSGYRPATYDEISRAAHED